MSLETDDVDEYRFYISLKAYLSFPAPKTPGWTRSTTSAMASRRLSALLCVLLLSILAIGARANVINDAVGLVVEKVYGAQPTPEELGVDPGHAEKGSARFLNLTDATWKTLLTNGSEWVVVFTQPESKLSSWLELTMNDAAYILSQEEEQLDLKFARVNCDVEVILCTTFWATKPPRIYRISPPGEARSIPFRRPDPAYFVKVLKDGYWKNAKPWTGNFDPFRGPLTIYVERAAVAMKWYSQRTSAIPGWMMMAAIGVATSWVMNWLHSGR